MANNMITNIKDNRQNYAKSHGLDFVIEPSCHDNDLKEATFYDPDDCRIQFPCKELLNESINSAITWANNFDFPVTLFIYDKLSHHPFTDDSSF